MGQGLGGSGRRLRAFLTRRPKPETGRPSSLPQKPGRSGAAIGKQRPAGLATTPARSWWRTWRRHPKRKVRTERLTVRTLAGRSWTAAYTCFHAGAGRAIWAPAVASGGGEPF